MILSTDGGEYLDRHTPGPGTPLVTRYNPPGTRYNPRDQVHLLGSGTPSWNQVHTPRTRYMPLPGTRYTPSLGPGNPQEQCMPGDTGNKRAVRILLECILVLDINFTLIPHHKMTTRETTTIPRSMATKTMEKKQKSSTVMATRTVLFQASSILTF